MTVCTVGYDKAAIFDNLGMRPWCYVDGENKMKNKVEKSTCYQKRELNRAVPCNRNTVYLVPIDNQYLLKTRQIREYK